MGSAAAEKRDRVAVVLDTMLEVEVRRALLVWLLESRAMVAGWVLSCRIFVDL